ncbi:hypothetical protein PVAND_009365 [Polypedilum vanderplanki]|uniref:Uncharacterized protein n=1 Tax=Polypedilum vanderplanki TaxID=319348 RepID=A0A9J6CDI0_POLVA|nr:hypothetical protein PVAND_009365 [Polypedilum vanderplanki]
MMMTPSKRRSLADHKDYYNNVKPKVETRWETGTPLMRKGKINKRKSNRRNSDSELLNFSENNLVSSSPCNIECSLINEECDNEAFVPSILINDHSVSYETHSNSRSSDISSHLEVVNFHFKDLFTQLEAYLNIKSPSNNDKKFVEMQLRDLQEQASQIEFMISDLTLRANRLEKFLIKRNEEQSE